MVGKCYGREFCLMKRITSGVLAVLLFLGAFFMNPVTALAENESTEATTIENTTETTTEGTTDESAENTTDESTEPTTGDSTTEPTTGEGEEKPTEPEVTTPKPEKIEYEGRTISADGMVILKLEEGFSKKPYWDYSQWTVGYGTCCPSELKDYYLANGITEEDAEILLHNHLIGVYKALAGFESKYGLSFTQNQFDALVLFSYNCGTSWMNDNSGTLPKALKAKATGNELIRAFAVWCNAGGSVKDYLLRRRLSESYMYLEGKYAQNPPSYYCYVIYNPNGGSVSPKSQGYNSNLTATVYATPTYSGHTFLGWYTQKVGGTKVTVLDASTKSKTLYAHWSDSEGNQDTTPEQFNTTVTEDNVNVRKGPGTNYTTVGVKNKGDKLQITETASGSGLRWGKFSGGWICLDYTDYEKEDTGNNEGTTGTSVMGTVISDEFLRIRKGPSTSTEEIGRLKAGDYVEILEISAGGDWGRIDRGWISLYYIRLDTDKEEEPEDTTPSTPSTPSTPETWTGTIINSNGGLRVRSGAGTNYPIVTHLYTGDKVTVTEKKTVGSVTWGKIAQGWISMEYVKLVTDSGDSGNTGNSGNTGSTTSTQSGTITASSLCIRTSAGTASTVCGYLSKGDKVTITQTTTVGATKWGKIEKGWISMDYVKLDGSDDSTDSGTTTNKIGIVVNCDEFLRIRSGAGIEYAHIGYVYPGDRLTILETKYNGSTQWARIDKGWVSMDYIRLETGDSGSTGTQKTVTANCLNVRLTAGTGKVVGYLYYGTKVTILETTTVGGTQWGRTSQGWISMDYVK